MLAAVAAILTAAFAASGASGRPRGHQNGPWATINVCDSKQPAFGVRGRMPGDGSTTERMYMRFTAQYKGKHGWQRLGHGRSPWVSVGSARFQFQESGWSFGLARPAHGQSFVLRGFVEFEWRTTTNGHTSVVRRARAYTQTGHPKTQGARPRNLSLAVCTIRSK